MLDDLVKEKIEENTQSTGIDSQITANQLSQNKVELSKNSFDSQMTN